MGIFYQAPTSKFSYNSVSRVLQKLEYKITSAKYVTTTVRSANFRPARARSALPASAGVSYFTNIFPTPVDCLLPPLGLGTFISNTFPYFAHSSLTSSQISMTVVSCFLMVIVQILTFVIFVINQFFSCYHIEKLKDSSILQSLGRSACEHGHGVHTHFDS